MPWTAKQAREKNKRIRGDKEAALWVRFANKTLRAELEKGTGREQAEAIAIRTANAAIRKAQASGGGAKESLESHDGSERLLEYTTSRGVALRVDREQGIIEGVKILGLKSLNGREYTPDAAREARGLYEGIAVNVDHVEGKAQRSYAQRIGKLSGVEIREDGLYGRLLVNPKHSLAEQLFWDAENAPDKVGLSHDARGKTKRRNGRTVVESIDAVRSVDLVAEPASTAGLFESISQEEAEVDVLDLREATLDQLREHRPDLLDSITAELAEAGDSKAKDAKIADLQKQLNEMIEAEAGAKAKAKIMAELKEAKLDDQPEVFVSLVLAEHDDGKRKALIDDRKQLVEAAGKTGKPRSDFAGGDHQQDKAGSFDWENFSESIREPSMA